MSTPAVTILAANPFRAWLDGKREVSLLLSTPTTLGALLLRLPREFAAFPRLPVEDRYLLQSELLVYADGRFLRPEDRVTPGMTLELLPSTAGG